MIFGIKVIFRHTYDIYNIKFVILYLRMKYPCHSTIEEGIFLKFSTLNSRNIPKCRKILKSDLLNKFYLGYDLIRGSRVDYKAN